MRRMPRPSWAIDPPSSISSPLLRHRVSSSCHRSLLTPCPHLRTTSAAFSTTPSHAFLLSGKQDKKKHQQFVRRWQKRLLGDSEPIGAHVDPYDPTSPVRIAPEEQGEEEEVLVEERREKNNKKRFNRQPSQYHQFSSGRSLRHVGGQEWRQQKTEVEMAKEFEKLTLRTYTPMDLRMADKIEDLTGTPYTLRDENLFMAQDYREATGKPYTELSWGRRHRVTDLPKLRAIFHQAVVEIYALKEAGVDMDLSTFANRGVYQPPTFVKDIKLHKTKSGDVALAFPRHGSAKALVESMQQMPEWDNTPLDEEVIEELTDGVEQEELVPQEPAQAVMDPDTPATHRTAVTKQDGEKKAFDFMSNRPTPRAKPTETPKEEAAQKAEVADLEPQPALKSPSSSIAVESAAKASQAAITQMRHDILDSASQRVEHNVSALRQAIRYSVTALTSTSVPGVKWRDVSLTDTATKFALTKRLLQLTGLYISDPHLTSANNLGDLYGYLFAAAKPKPTKLYSILKVEGQKAREQAKKHSTITTTTHKRRQDLGDLLTLRNVELRKKRLSPKQKRITTGLDKVVKYALAERGLINTSNIRASIH